MPRRRRIGSALALLAGIVVLPALAWLVSRIVAEGPLRSGVLTIGLAPCEIASVATVAMAGGQSAVAAVMLIGSTILSVALAGPILTVLSRQLVDQFSRTDRQPRPGRGRPAGDRDRVARSSATWARDANSSPAAWRRSPSLRWWR